MAFGGFVKKKTRGTSNEISFSVLDGMAETNDTAEEKSPLGRISLFTLGVKRAAGTPSKDPALPEKFTAQASDAPGLPAWELPSSEVRQRRARRKRGMRTRVAVVSCACIAVLAVAAGLTYGFVQQMQDKAMNVSEHIAVVKGLQEEVQGLTAPLAEALQKPLQDIDAQALTTALETLQEKHSSVATKLRAEHTALNDMQKNLMGAQVDRAKEAADACTSLLKALESGYAAMKTVADAAQAYEQAEAFYNQTIAADSKAREAAAHGLATNSAALASIALSDEAINAFAEARTSVQNAQKLATAIVGNAGAFQKTATELMQPFVDYTNLRIQAQEQAKATDRAYLARSSAGIAAANGKYNELEAEAAKLITEQRGAYPADIVMKAYQSAMPAYEPAQAFTAEMARAADYLGAL